MRSMKVFYFFFKEENNNSSINIEKISFKLQQKLFIIYTYF